MNNKENAFDKLNCLIEDTEILLIKKIPFQVENYDELKFLMDEYFEKYEYKSNIVRGIISTVSFKNLIIDKLSTLIMLKNQCIGMIDNIDIPHVIMTDEDMLLFSKKSILENRIKPILDFVINEIELCITETSSINTDEDIEIDLSETTGTEKIIFLQKLGIIDFLRTKKPFNTSINSMAIVLSAITGEKSGTLQPMLNPMLNQGTAQKNNPLNSQKKVQKVEQQLINIGVN